MIRGDIIHTKNIRPNFQLAMADQMAQHKTFGIPYDFDEVFGDSMRRNDIDMFVTNRQDFGYLIDSGYHIVIERWFKKNRFPWNYFVNLLTIICFEGIVARSSKIIVGFSVLQSEWNQIIWQRGLLFAGYFLENKRLPSITIVSIQHNIKEMKNLWSCGSDSIRIFLDSIDRASVI